jgi:hypothetical protein
VDYLYLLPAFVRDCRAPGVHLIDPLAIPRERLNAFANDIGLDCFTAEGLGLLGDPMENPDDPSGSSLYRYLPLSLGYGGYEIAFCYYDLESNEAPGQLFKAGEQVTVVNAVCDEWIQGSIRIFRGQVLASPVDMLVALAPHVHHLS